MERLFRYEQNHANIFRRKPDEAFLKWADGKAPIVDRIKAVLPAGERLVEPFVGSGALSLNGDWWRP